MYRLYHYEYATTQQKKHIRLIVKMLGDNGPAD